MDNLKCLTGGHHVPAEGPGASTSAGSPCFGEGEHQKLLDLDIVAASKKVPPL